jgi:dTDP-4-amino-4,6-dideoxygalactose transaminase
MTRIYLSPPHVGPEERQFLLEAFDSNWIAPLGPHVDAFERELAAVVGVPHAVALSSGTAALHLGLRIMGVGPGDEVMTSTLTFAATANAITYCGAQPVFVDVAPGTWTLDPDVLADELAACARRGRLPKAVVPVDLYGQSADYHRIHEVCAPYEVPVFADAAEALGATYRGQPAGRATCLAAFSFNGNKIITTGGGGMLVGNRREWIDRARHLAAQARDAAPHYEHSTVGYNYRMSNLLAAVGRAQLRQLPARVAARRATRAFYQETLAECAGVTFMPEAPYGRSNGWLTCILLDPDTCHVTPAVVRLHLEARNIESRPVWKPMHMQPVFAGCRARGGEVAAGLFARGLCLPSGSSLSQADRERVVDALLSVPGRAAMVA